MPDYKEMYRRLFQSQAQAIEILIKAQQTTEEIYMSASEDNVKHLKIIKMEDDDVPPQNSMKFSTKDLYLV